MERTQYFQNINAIKSPLILLPDALEQLIPFRTDDLTEPIKFYVSFAQELKRLNQDTTQTRAEFIELQCRGAEEATFFFEQHRESWGIPIFKEDLLTADDFKYGFLWTFRDHSTSWCEDQEARHWFFHSIEARTVRHYQFWACDEGTDEILLSTSGDYKSILWTLVKKYQDYSALMSPIFTGKELLAFYNSFDESQADLYKTDLLEIIQENPNWK